MLLTRDNFSGDVAFMHGFVRQHRLPNDVTNSKNVLHVGTQLLVHFNKAAVSDFHTSFFSSKLFTVWRTTYGNQHSIIFDWCCRRFIAFKSDINTVFLGFNLSRFGA